MKYILAIFVICVVKNFEPALATVDDERMVTLLEKTIELGKYKKDVTDRDMYRDWEEFTNQMEKFKQQFNQSICTEPEKLESLRAKMEELVKEVQSAWRAKQEQLKDLSDVLNNVKYSETGLATGNDGLKDSCKGLEEYIEKANKTAQEENEDLDDHIDEVEKLRIMLDTHPCPCTWGPWSDWTQCSTTCETGVMTRDRKIERAATNGGEECTGDTNVQKMCNEDVCCPVDCQWGPWQHWPACPSGCGQVRTRQRIKEVEDECNGIPCTGTNFQSEDCSREGELEQANKKLMHRLEECQHPEFNQLTKPPKTMTTPRQ